MRDKILKGEEMFGRISHIIVSAFIIVSVFSVSSVSGLLPGQFPTAMAEDEKPASEPEADEKDYNANPLYDLEERDFHDSDRDLNDPDNDEYYERLDEKKYN